MPFVAFGLGSNLGNRLDYLSRAATALVARLVGASMSGIYESPPMYNLEQPAFLNMAVAGESVEGPLALIALAKSIQSELGRLDRGRNGPREIDVDLLVCGVLRYENEGMGSFELIVPHPRLAERRFVLEPLAEVAPTLLVSGSQSVAELLESAEVQAQSVVRISDAPI